MNVVVSWARLLDLIEPHYPKVGNGRRPYPVAAMLRIYFLQQRYQLSDPGAEEAVYDIQSMRIFGELELGCDADFSSAVDERQGWPPRPGHEQVKEWQPVVLRDEGAHWRV